MRKNFTTPAIEIRELSALNSVMDGDLAIFATSPGQQESRSGLSLSDKTTQEGYNAWKGFRNK